MICCLAAKSCPTLGKVVAAFGVLVRGTRQSPVLGTEGPRAREAVVTCVPAPPLRPWRMARGTGALLLKALCAFEKRNFCL